MFPLGTLPPTVPYICRQDTQCQYLFRMIRNTTRRTRVPNQGCVERDPSASGGCEALRNLFIGHTRKIDEDHLREER